MIHWFDTQWMINKTIYLILAAGVIEAYRYWMTSHKSIFASGRAFRVSLIFKGIHLAIVTGFILLMGWDRPAEYGLKTLRLGALLWDESLTCGLLLIYFAFYLFESYRLDQKFRGIRSPFGSYLMQYSFFQILLFDVLLLIRLEDTYLPIFCRKYPRVNPDCVEAILILIFIGIQGIALWVRGLKMADAPLEIRETVAEVARVFGVKIYRIKAWKLEMVNNAFATGLLRRRIFLTQSLLEHSDSDYLRMIVGHECAHFKLHHLEIRMILIAVLVLTGSLFMDIYPELSWIYILGYAIFSFLVFNAIARTQEFQADRLSAEKLGGGPLMAQALTGTFGMESTPGWLGKVWRRVMLHPEMAERVKRLEKM